MSAVIEDGEINEASAYEQEAPPETERRPLVAIVGRPNVGKSSVFNRLTGQSKSVVTPVEGTTRDRVYGTVEWMDWQFVVVDTGGLLGDTDEWSSDIHEQAMVAIQEADVIVFVVDVQRPISPKERELARKIRSLGKSVVLVANKADNANTGEALAKPFERLGLGEPVAFSAIHSLGEITLFEELFKNFEKLKFRPVKVEKEDEELEEWTAEKALAREESGAEKKKAAELAQKAIRIAIVGKPNVGKSSFLNRVVGSDRSVVSNVAGTTVDPVDERLIWRKGGKEYNVVLVGAHETVGVLTGHVLRVLDTAGLKKKNLQKADSIEHLSALWALKVIDRCDISLLLLDTQEGILNQDIHIAEFVAENFKSSVIVFNKWDTTMDVTETKEKDYIAAARRFLPNITYSPVLFCSARTGYHVTKVLDEAVDIVLNRRKKIPSSEIMKVLATCTLMRAPPSNHVHRLRFKFATQADASVPTFTFFVNDPELRNTQYDRFLENRFREEFPSLEGSPLRFMYRKNVGNESKRAAKATKHAPKVKKHLHRGPKVVYVPRWKRMADEAKTLKVDEESKPDKKRRKGTIKTATKELANKKPFF